MAVDEKLLEILACPVCKVKVKLAGDWIVCPQCQRHYPIRDDIPIMLVDEAVDGQQQPSSQQTGGE